MGKPAPVVTARVCSLCGLDWARHGKAPTAEKCIELLLADLRAAEARAYTRPWAYVHRIPYPVPQPYPVYPRPYPIWSTSGGQISGGTSCIRYTPANAAVTPRAIAAHSTC